MKREDARLPIGSKKSVRKRIVVHYIIQSLSQKKDFWNCIVKRMNSSKSTEVYGKLNSAAKDCAQ